MVSQVYYRKWRPRRFGELVGQDAVATTLRQAVAQGRLSHAYLFCGPRGTGKTTTARILAKAANCLDPQDREPCDTCTICQAINEGRFMDLIEVDAASNRRIEEMRDLRERVRFGPTQGRYKVYIIDEAHMLTPEASNAFLKTLEEPPSYVIFVLCTTEPHRVLPTIVSRCQRFDFRRLSSEAIVKRLSQICREEGIETEPSTLDALARNAWGSMRDAENLLEQLVVSYGPRVGLRELQDLLGLGGSERALELVRHILNGSTKEALSVVNSVAWEGLDLRQFHRQVLDCLRGVLMLQCGARETLDYPAETLEALGAIASRAPMGRVLRATRLLGEVNLRYDSPSPLPLELAVVEACVEEPEEAPRASESQRTASGTRGSRTERPSISPASAQGRPFDPVPMAAGAVSRGLEGQWEALVKSLSRYKGRRFIIGALLRDCKTRYLEGDTVVLGFTHRSHLERMQEELEDPECQRAVGEAFFRALGSHYQFRLTLAEENSTSNTLSTQSPLVRAALGMGARIVEEENEQGATPPGPAATGQAGQGPAGAGEPYR